MAYSGDTPVQMLKLPNLRRTRQLKLWSMRELSERSGVPLNTISRIELGHQARYDTVKKLCDALEVDVRELVGGE